MIHSKTSCTSSHADKYSWKVSLLQNCYCLSYARNDLWATEQPDGQTENSKSIWPPVPEWWGHKNKHTHRLLQLQTGTRSSTVACYKLKVCRLQLNSARFLYLATVPGVGGPGAIITAARRGVALQAHTCNRGQIYRRWHMHNYRFPKSQVVKSWNFIWLLNCPPFKPDSWKQRDDSLNDFIYDYLERLLVFCQLLTKNRA